MYSVCPTFGIRFSEKCDISEQVVFASFLYYAIKLKKKCTAFVLRLEYAFLKNITL